MKFISCKKILEGKFINRYDLEYETNSGSKKIYEMISRNKSMSGLEDIISEKIDAVVLIVHNKDKSKILLNKEFRLAAGQFVYNFPAGLIDPGETIEQAGARELWEETGLKLVSIEGQLPLSYSAVGFSNETNACIIGTAEGAFASSTSDVEEIEARWYTKDEIRKLLQSAPFAARTQAYCYLWSKE